MVMRPPEPALRNLPTYQQSLHVFRWFSLAFMLLLAPLDCCSLGDREQDGWVLGVVATLPLSGLVGGVIFFWAVTTAANAIDASAWTVDQAGLRRARQLALVAGCVLTGGIIAPLAALFFFHGLSQAYLFTPLAALGLAMPCSFAWIYSHSFRILAEWHRTAPPEVLRPATWSGSVSGFGTPGLGARHPVFPPYQSSSAGSSPGIPTAPTTYLGQSAGRPTDDDAA